MKTHHTKTKGDLGVLKAIADLCEKGYLVCFPMSEHAPFDLVIYKSGQFRRVQVKARTINSVGALTVRFDHCYSDSKGVHSKKVDLEEIDLYCIYCLNNNQCYYFDKSTINHDSTISFRVEAPRNNQLANIRFAEDFREVP
jgi:PD-(D/E)XK endonuclease